MNSSSENELPNEAVKRATEVTISDATDNHDYCETPFKKPKLDDTMTLKSVVEYIQTEHRRCQESMLEHALELFFLESGGHMIDYFTWRKKPPPQFLENLRLNVVNSEQDYSELADLKSLLESSTKMIDPVSVPAAHATPSPSRAPSLVVSSASVTPTSTFQTPATAASTAISLTSPQLKTVTSPTVHTPTTTTVGSRLSTRQHSISSFYDSAIGSQEQIVERAKQEAYVMQRIAELRKEGLWSNRRLPKVQEPFRCKAHWDYLLEEMAWLATDFAQERKWKKAAAKKCARMVMKYHQDKQCQAERAEKEELLRLKKIASNISKQIKQFWSDIEKVVEARQEARLKEKRKKLHDMHLNFIVDKADQYTEKLTQELGKTTVDDSGFCSQDKKVDEVDDSEFEPENSESDDEETIAKEEEEVGVSDHNQEIEMLKKESEMPIEDLMANFEQEMLSGESSDIKSLKETQDESKLDDGEFKVDESIDEEDDEQTIEEQERIELNQNYAEEIKELESDANLSIEELIQKYSAFSPKISEESEMSFEEAEDAAGDTEDNDEEESEIDSQDDEEVKSEEESDDVEEDDDEEMYDDDQFSDQDSDEVKDIGMEFLINPDAEFKQKVFIEECDGAESTPRPNKEITDIAAGAESLQPKGNTLSAVEVCTKVPFLLKHQLREYQHIGLDWLVAMHDKKLNGILADEMGLGKTIQTIALLAHLACEKGIWGPHLIVVPTSVMLNWEMEFKKWCPGFKILTYYGSPKERKQKRQGWTKPNQFHVCITSYKLVIQDHYSFRRKKWRFLILDEAQHIKNFKSQRWQMLLNFNTSRRLLLTGTPLQNNLMELWSLMHFLMPTVFDSHKEFKDWFVNPVSGMIEGNQEMNEGIIRRLHKVLRPFLLRRLKCDVEKQLPKKYEHVVMCRLSKRQRFLYEEYMSRGKTKETLASGNFLSVINILMQLRKVCNHPDLFEPRPTISPFMMEGIDYYVPSLVTTALDYDPFTHVDLNYLNLVLINLSLTLSAFAHHRIKRFMATSKLIEEIDSSPEPPPRCPRGKIRLQIRTSTATTVPLTPALATPRSTTSPTVITRLQNPEQKFVITSNQNITAQINSTSQSTVEGKQVAIPFGRLVQTPQGQHILLRTTTGNQISPTIVHPNQITPTSPMRQIILTRNPQIQAGSQQDQLRQLNTVKSSVQNNNLKQKQQGLRKEKLSLLGRINLQRCNAAALYASDLIEVASINTSAKFLCRKTSETNVFAVGNGHLNCSLAPFADSCYLNFCTCTQSLSEIINTPEKVKSSLHDILARYVCIVPPVVAPQIQLHASHYSSSKRNNQEYFNKELHSNLSHRLGVLHPVIRNFKMQFPELRLIQYDCGKLQTLDKLLWELKTGGHRALIFTQMSRMLDIFEQFLNYHGHTYLRLDGTTRIEQRQALMERFNADKRIFCFILSTRSGGIGVNLTGADTVIFYDSDWNPTMDAQAQDRCHRIGQTRDVHIYRLISEKSVEENILKKAQQKRLLGDVAIEGGNFTTAFFKRNAIQELFGIELPNDKSGPQIEVVVDEVAETQELGESQLEQALCTAEEDNDIAAAKIARAEAAAEFAEFDESIPIDEPKDVEEKSPEEEKIDELIEQLKPVEKYAMQILESISDSFSLEQMKQAEEEIEAQKKEWELGRLKNEKEEEERLLVSLQEEKEPMLTCPREEVYNQVYYNGLEQMTIWTPPTPPQDENDLYIDYSLGFLYEQSIMPESMLPPVYVPKESNKRMRLDTSDGRIVRKSKPHRKEEGFNIPRSLFDRPSTTIIKLRRELILQKLKSVLSGADSAAVHRTLNAVGASCMPTHLQLHKTAQMYQSGFQYDSLPSWAIHEDWTVISVLQFYQDLPLNLLVLNPAHIPNWDLISDVVNSVSCNYRSAKLCKYHFETSIVPREEGKVPFDTPPKQKQKKLKGNVVTPSAPVPVAPIQTKTIKTNQMFLQDNNLTFSQQCNQRFETIKQIANKRTPTLKPMFLNQSGKNPKHLALLSENGINYDQPLTPMQVAQNRAERISREKQKAQAEQAQQLALRQQQQQMQHLQVKSQTQQIKAILTPTSNVPAAQQQLQQAISAKVAALSKSPTTSTQLTNLTKALCQVPSPVPTQTAHQNIQQPVINKLNVSAPSNTAVGNISQQTTVDNSAAGLTQHPTGTVLSVTSLSPGHQKLIAPVGQVTSQPVSARFTVPNQTLQRQLLLQQRQQQQQQQQQQIQLQRQGQPIQIQNVAKQTIGISQPQTRFQISSSTISRQPIQQSLIASSGVKTTSNIVGSGTLGVAIPVASGQQQRILTTSSATSVGQQSLIVATTGLKSSVTSNIVNTGTIPVAVSVTGSPQQTRILTTTSSIGQQVQNTQSLIASAGLKSSSPNVISTGALPVPIAGSGQQRILTTTSSGKPTQQIITRTIIDSVQMAQILKGQRSIVNTQTQQGNLQTTQILHLQPQTSQQQSSQPQTQQILQNPVILVKTLPTPATLATQSITIPVSSIFSTTDKQQQQQLNNKPQQS